MLINIEMPPKNKIFKVAKFIIGSLLIICVVYFAFSIFAQ